MAFKVVTIADRISQYPDRRRLTKEDGSSELVTVAAEEGTVSAEGTEWGAAYANDLETRIDAETHLLEGNFGTVETTTTASKAYAVGQCLTLNGQLYKVIAAISKGATLVVGTNIAVHSVSAINSNLGSLQFKYEADRGYYRLVGADTWLPFSSKIIIPELTGYRVNTGAGGDGVSSTIIDSSYHQKIKIGSLSIANNGHNYFEVQGSNDKSSWTSLLKLYSSNSAISDISISYKYIKFIIAVIVSNNTTIVSNIEID